jgi:exonuclease III
LGSNTNCNDGKFNPHLQKKNLLTIYHQNICGLSSKSNELIIFLHPHFPDVLCLTEQQLKQAQLELNYLDNYHLGAGHCRPDRRNGGVSIFIHGDLKHSKVKMNEFCKEQHIEACAINTESSF